MKRIATLLLVLALLAVGACALAASAIEVDEPYQMYAIQDDVKVYAKHSTKSDVLRTLAYNEEITVVKVTDDDKWAAFTYKDKDKKKTTGWVQQKYLSDELLCEHDWGKWKVTVEPTCTEDGERTRTCKLCGLAQSEALEKTDHEWGKWKVTSEATCTEEGEKVRYCLQCDEKQTKVIKMLEHTYGEWEIVRKPTCTKVGLRIRTCEECEHEEEEEIEKLPHTYGDWEETLAATCTREGEEARECEVCGHLDTRVLKKLPHSYGAWKVTVQTTDHSAGTRAKTCAMCGNAVTESFDPEGTLRKGARGDGVREIQQLLADQGYLTAGGVDGSYGGGTERALKLFQKDQNLNPDGIAWPQTIKRLHHEFGEWQTVTPLTRAHDGERVRVCVDCGYEQHETLSAAQPIKTWSRGEDVRTIQKMLSELGYVTGTADGVYGPKLDAAYATFALEHGRDFAMGQLTADDLDALASAWVSEGGEKWMGKGDRTSPVNLMLTVTPTDDGNGDMRTYDMALTNLGGSGCRFDALLLGYGDSCDFTGDVIALIVDGFQLRANGGNTMNASFSVSSDWGEGQLNICAVATLERTGQHWLSNARTFEGFAQPEQPEPQTEGWVFN